MAYNTETAPKRSSNGKKVVAMLREVDSNGNERMVVPSQDEKEVEKFTDFGKLMTTCEYVEYRPGKKRIVEFLNDIPRKSNSGIPSTGIITVPTAYPIALTTDYYGKNIQSHNIARYDEVYASEKKSVYQHLDGAYYQSDDGYYVKTSKEDMKRFTDFVITIMRRQRKVSSNGSVLSESLLLNLSNSDGDSKELEIMESDYHDLFTVISKKAPSYQIFVDEIPNYRDRFRRLSGIILKRAKLEVQVLYSHFGWSEIDSYGNRIFLHGGMENCSSEKVLLTVRDEEAARILYQSMRILEVGEPEVVTPFLLYTLASHTDAIFSDAGFPLAHCMMLIGDTGFLKSSLARVLCSPFSPRDKRIYTIRGTEASFNVLTETYMDDTLAVDDFNYEGSPQEIRQKHKIIRGLVRGYSDKTPRTKYGGADNIKQYRIRGGCVFTGETKLTGQIKSSELRYIKIFFRKRIDREKLAVFQESDLVLYLASEYIRYLQSNYSNLVERVRGSFPKLRDRFRAISEPRLIDSCSHLFLVATFLGEMLASRGCGININDWENDCETILRTILTKQSEDVQVVEPYKQYLGEIWNLLGTGKIKIADDLTQYIKNLDFYGGYRDGDLLWLKKDETYSEVQKAFYARNDSLPISSDDASLKIKAAGLSKCDVNSCLKKASSKIPGRPRMMVLYYIKVDALLKGEM